MARGIASARQLELLQFIRCYQFACGGVSPTLREMAQALGLKGKASVHRELVNLELANIIRRLPRRERAIELLVDPPVSRAPDGALLYFVPLQPEGKCHG